MSANKREQLILELIQSSCEAYDAMAITSRLLGLNSNHVLVRARNRLNDSICNIEMFYAEQEEKNAASPSTSVL